MFQQCHVLLRPPLSGCSAAPGGFLCTQFDYAATSKGSAIVGRVESPTAPEFAICTS